MKKILLFFLMLFCLLSTSCSKSPILIKESNNVIQESSYSNKEYLIKIYDFLKNCKFYYLATTENKQPRVRPFGTIDLFEDKLYIHTGKTKNVSKQMAKNPRIEICAFDGTDIWVRIEATVVNDDRTEAKQHMFDKGVNVNKRHPIEDPNFQVLYFSSNLSFLICWLSVLAVSINGCSLL